MTNLEAAILVCEHAAKGTPELQAYAALTRGDDGVKGVKREAFAQEYAQLLHSPLLRKLRVRVAREDDYRIRLADVVTLIDCEEMVAPDIAKALTEARENPRKVPPCLTLITPYVTPEQIVDLTDHARALWPDVFPTAVTGG